MLAYHDDYDVMQPAELLNWQHYILDNVCGQMPPATKDKSFMRLPRKVREELHEAISDAEIAALSADVSTYPYMYSSFKYFKIL